MGMLTESFAPRAQASAGAGPIDEFWYRDISGYLAETGSSGIGLSAETILNCSTVLAAVRFRGDSWAMCPPATFRKTPSGRQEDPTHYSQRVLRKPNTWQTGNRWRHLNGVWMATWGNAYNEIVAGASTFAKELRPLHPSRCRVADQRSDGTLVYRYEPAGEDARTLGQEKVLHFRDLSTDGLSGVPMYKLIRNVVGIALLAERHASTFLRKGARSAGVIVPDRPLAPEERSDLIDSINKGFGGVQNSGTYGLLPHGVKLEEAPTSTNRDGQVLEIGDQVVRALLQFMGVPGVVVGFADKTATYASAKEFFESGGIKHCVLPILSNVEAEEDAALLVEGDGRFIKHNLDVLLRANTIDRFSALFKAVGGPWMTVNEARRVEDMNEDPDPRHDEILTPANMSPRDDPEPDDEPGAQPPVPNPIEPEPEGEMRRPTVAPKALKPAPPESEDEQAARAKLLAEQFALDAAARVVRREIAAVKGPNGGGAAVKYAKDPEKWRAWALDWYAKHESHVAETLHIPAEAARAYATAQRDALLAGGVAVVETWEETVPHRLAALVLEGTC
jgi:HK97 family phage portal protein